MNVIDALVVTLGMDRRQYKTEQTKHREESKRLKEDVKADAEDLEKSGRKINDEAERNEKQRVSAQKKITEGLNATKRQALETFAVLVGANSIKNYIANTVQAASATDRMAKAAGVGVQDLEAFGMMIRRNGGDANAAKASIAELARAMEMWRTLGVVSPELNAAFTQIGANPSDDPTEVYKKYAEWAKNRDPRLVAQTGAMLGFDEGSINMAMRGRDAVEKNLEQSKRLGALNAEQAHKIRELQNRWENLTQAIQGNALSLLTDASPAMSHMLDQVSQGVEKFPTLTKLVIGLGAALTSLGGIRLGAGILRLLGIGGGAAATAEGAGATVAGGISAGALAVPAAIIGTIAYAVHPSGGETGEDAAMKRINSRWRGGGQNRFRQTIDYFKGQGWSEQEATGIAAGIRAENGAMDPTAKNPHSSAYGLGQWLTPRQRDFKQFSGRDIQGSSFEDQLAFINWELKHKESHAGGLIRGRGAKGAAYAYLAHYMRPGSGLGGDLRRADKALAQNISIGTVTVQTASNDARGIARDIRGAIRDTGFTAQANSGVD